MSKESFQARSNQVPRGKCRSFSCTVTHSRRVHQMSTLAEGEPKPLKTFLPQVCECEAAFALSKTRLVLAHTTPTWPHPLPQLDRVGKSVVANAHKIMVGLATRTIEQQVTGTTADDAGRRLRQFGVHLGGKDQASDRHYDCGEGPRLIAQTREQCKRNTQTCSINPTWASSCSIPTSRPGWCVLTGIWGRRSRPRAQVKRSEKTTEAFAEIKVPSTLYVRLRPANRSMALHIDTGGAYS